MAVTARMCVSLANAGGAAVYRTPHAVSPVRVSHTQGGPGPRMADSAKPRRVQRLTMTRTWRSVRPSKTASWSSWRPYISATKTRPAVSWLVALAEMGLADVTLSSDHETDGRHRGDCRGGGAR